MMRNLVKLLSVIVLITMTTKSFAQTFAIKAGLNLSNMVIKNDDETYSDDFKSNLGFHVGPTVEFPINHMFAFETGLLFSTKGFKYNYKATSTGETSELNLRWNTFNFDIPLTAKAKFGAGTTKFYGVFGPYLGIGLSGKITEEMSYMGETSSDNETIRWGSDEDDYLRRLDFGLTAGAGVAIKSFEIGLSYNFGLANISPSAYHFFHNGFKIKNQVLGISIAYKFGRK